MFCLVWHPGICIDRWLVIQRVRTAGEGRLLPRPLQTSQEGGIYYAGAIRTFSGKRQCFVSANDLFWGIGDCSEELEPAALYVEVQVPKFCCWGEGWCCDLAPFEPSSLVNTSANGGCSLRESRARTNMAELCLKVNAIFVALTKRR